MAIDKFSEIWKRDSPFIVNVIRMIIAGIVIVIGVPIFLLFTVAWYIICLLIYLLFNVVLKNIIKLIDPLITFLGDFGRYLYKYLMSPLVKFIEFVYFKLVKGIKAIIQPIAFIYKCVFRKILLSKIKRFLLKIILYLIFPEIKLLEGVWYLIDSFALVCEKIWDGIDIISTYSGRIAFKIFQPFGGGLINLMIAIYKSRVAQFAIIVLQKLLYLIEEALVEAWKIIYEIFRYLFLAVYYILVFLNHVIKAIIYITKKLFKVLAINQLYQITKSATRKILKLIGQGLATLFKFLMLPIILAFQLTQPIFAFIGITIKETLKIVGKAIKFVLEIFGSIFS